MFGKDDELEKVKSALAAMDGDMSAFRVWQKQYDKLNRQWQAVQERYQKARQITEQVHRNAKQLEEILVDDTQGQRKEAAQILKEWKRLQNGFDHEFLISKEDREFHSTYDTIVRLGIKAVDKEDQKLILQSEVENLIALLEENLEKKQPSAWKLCFFTLNHGEQELIELPPAEKLNCIDTTYQQEFLQPIIALLVFAIDRAGLVGADGETHQGNFDLSYLSMMPGMTVMAPKNDWELEAMLEAAVNGDGPYAIRYPKGTACTEFQQFQAPILRGKAEILSKGKKAAILAVGSMVSVCQDAVKLLKEQGIDPTFVNARFIKPLDTALLDELAEDHQLFVTVEENVKSGGFGEHVCAYMEACHPGCRVIPIAIWDRFVPQGSIDSLRCKVGLSAAEIAQTVETGIS